MIPVKPNDVTWTDEQWEAIYEDGKNIIVSAGAGSGKTAVLTERVIRKLKDGVHINQLLILTFTKAAAAEMADRIRKKIKKIPELREELNLLDSAYITTFDSFALSVVKKYHYLINISNDVDIIDDNVIALTKKRFMDQIFDNFYVRKEPLFLKMIKNFCLKDDDDIKKYILNISNKLELLSNKKQYLADYLKIYYNDEKIKKDIDKYFILISNKLETIKLKVEEISFIDNDFAVKLNDSLSNLYGVKSYDDLVNKLSLKLPIVPRGSCDELKCLKSEISDIIKEIKALVVYSDTEEIKNTINLTKDTIKVIINIILEFWELVDNYKKKNNCYEFNDIAIMAIDILKNNKDVCEELLNNFNEIMIDEYQDTNDLQEEFISMISHHNVYMVGDIKQSIYRFRNANPYIFKEKYDNYSNSDIDKKIDLNKNFRSRDEVLSNINQIFNLIMNQDIGGADYIKEHQMIFGNKSYLKEKPNHSNDLEIYSYNYDKELGFKKEEIEAFIIADDIINKYNTKIKIFDKDTSKLRDIRYSDFSIIIDRSTDFDLYKKIFSYYGIPVTLLKDEKMNDTDDINVIRNLIRLLLVVKNNIFDKEFKYLFISIYRSFLFKENDDKIFDYFFNNSFKTSELYLKCLDITYLLDSITITELLDVIEDSFSYYEKLITIGNINNNIVKWEKLKELAGNLEKMGYDIEMFSSYLMDLTDNDLSINYKVNGSDADSVKIMTIHKSKGLEYPICYFSGLYKKFNISDLKEKFIYDKNYGIIVPYFNEGIGQTIYKELLKNTYLKEEISEKIRLFYVALTRVREKIIIVNPLEEDNNRMTNVNVLPNSIKLAYRSLADIINSISYQLKDYNHIVDLNNINLSHKYNEVKTSNYHEKINDNDDVINIRNLKINSNNIEEKHFSKSTNELFLKKDYDNIRLGLKMHELLEMIDLKNPDYSIIKDSFQLNVLKNLLSNDLLKNLKNANVYKEYEFIYYQDNIKYHGIIDLMLEYDEYIDIIDYKLKNIQDKAYKSQLQGYKNYIKSRTNKHINLYLYSLLEHKFYKIC